MKTIAIINNKGGVGKTSTVTTISHILAEKFGKSVLMIDMDPQSNTSSQYSRIDFFDLLTAILDDKQVSIDTDELIDVSDDDKKRLSTKYTIEDILLHKNIPTESAIIPTQYANLDILPARLTLATAEQQLKADSTIPQQFILQNKLKEVNSMYDYCIIDCSPSVSLLNINVLNAADEVYIPINSDGWSMIGMAITKKLIDTVSEYNPKVKIGGVFFNQFKINTNVAKATYATLEEMLPQYDIPLLPFTIPPTKYLQETSIVQEPLLRSDPKGKAIKQFTALCSYIISDNKEDFLKKYNPEN